MVQVALSLDTWIWNAEAYAASQRMPTLQICCWDAEVDLQPLRVAGRA